MESFQHEDNTVLPFFGWRTSSQHDRRTLHGSLQRGPL